MIKRQTVIGGALVLALFVTLGLLYHHRPFRTRMSAYVTDLGNRSEAQRRNIELAGLPIHETILQPGDSFSLNHRSGPYTERRGFRPERSFRSEQLAESPGGGVCQLASTLYNAVRLAGLRILERVPHSQPVHSVPRGMDATVAYGVADLKFKNPYPFPVQIRSKILRDQLLIEIWGKESK